MKNWLRTNQLKVWSWILGLSLVFFAIHNTGQFGLSIVFLPTLGLILCVFIVLLLLYDTRKRITLGSKYIYIPLLIIVASMSLSGFINGATWQAKIVPLSFGGVMFGLYLLSRIMGDEIFKPFMWAVVIVAISAIPYAILLKDKTGGLASGTNYDMGAGLLIFGTLVSSLKKRWWIASIAIMGLFFMGAEEGYIALGILGLTVLIRHDFSKKLLLPIGMAVIAIFGLILTGHIGTVINPTIEKINMASSVMLDKPVYAKGEHIIYQDREYVEILAINKSEALDYATGYRWVTHWALSPIKPFGYGYNINQFYNGIPHNIVLIIIEQVGTLAALAWFYVVLYCLIKTKWKYAFIGILALGIFDHYLWTQVAPWTWALIGVASASNIKSDLIFKEA